MYVCMNMVGLPQSVQETLASTVPLPKRLGHPDEVHHKNFGVCICVCMYVCTYVFMYVYYVRIYVYIMSVFMSVFMYALYMFVCV